MNEANTQQEPDSESATETGEQPAGDGAKDEPRGGGTRATHQFTQEANQEFHTKVENHGNVYLGMHGAPGGTTSKAVTGELSKAEIHTLRTSPVRSPVHGEAVRLLSDARVLVIFGRPGSGREHGGTAVLACLDPQKIFVLTPGLILDELARRGYQEGCAYFAEAVREGADRRMATDAWRRVRTRLADCGAWLLAVSAEEAGDMSGAGGVRRLRWEPPDIAEILTAHGLDAATAEVVRDELPDEPAMGSVIRTAELVASGTNPKEAVQHTFGLAAAATVRDWFASTPSRAEICSVTVLALTGGLRHRDHGMCLMKFESILDKHIPPSADDDKEREDLPRRRGAVLNGDGLMTCDRIVRHGAASSRLRFKDPAYRSHVLRELWGEYDERFWYVVHEWVHEYLLDDTVRFNLSVGLALLAREAYDEVEPDYLLPWSQGRDGWRGQQAAVWVLSVMCTDEALSKTALDTANDWVNHGTSQQRWTGAVAFTGLLGVRYPEEAARRMWQLVTQCTSISPAVAQSMGQLFATLVEAEGRSHHVLALLRKRLDLLRPTGRDAPRYRLAMKAVLAVLSTKLPDGGKPAIVVLLLARPDRRPLICRIWADALRYGPARLGALRALAQALRGIERLSEHAEREATALGEELRRALGPAEQAALRRDLPNVMARNPAHRDRPSPLTKILLAALDAASPSPESE
ncbi:MULTISPECIES: hypothetical protein [unclassified Actinomadura]|uniref:hypothetical protein n=1 Tax=unclassified Actinomadura TaxID=2626254 RepID=UPI0011ECCAAD|nr:hypothetical protein [Actinomadura sp. K4S16]